MLSNAYFLAKFRFDTAENDPAKNLQNFRKMHLSKMHFRKCIEVARRLPAARRGFPGRGAPAVRELPRRSRGEGGEERGGAAGGLRLPRGGGAAGVLSGRNQEKHDESGLRLRI